VFLSHGTADRAVVESIHDQLTALGIGAIRHEHDKLARAKLAENLQQEIQASDGVIVLFTKDSKAVVVRSSRDRRRSSRRAADRSCD